MGMTGGMAWMALCAGLFLIVFVGGAAGIVWLAQRSGDNWPGRHDPVEAAGDQARRLLQSRYASGEIDEDEYFRRLSGLAQR